MNISVAGAGIVSAMGSGLHETCRALKAGRGNPLPPTLFDSRIDCPVFEVKNPAGDQTRPGTRTLALALAAAREAVQGSDWAGSFDRWRVGVCIGSTVASQLSNLDFYRHYRSHSECRTDAVEDYLDGNLGEAIGRHFNTGDAPACVIVNACSSGSDAIGTAMAWLNSGLCDVAIAGGADELSLVPLSGFNSLGIVSSRPCMPFDRNRAGLNLGEGAGILVLETEEVSDSRKRHTGIQLVGYGAASDAYHLTAPHPEGRGLESALLLALREAELDADSIAFVNTHGTATPDNDRVEGRTLHRILGTKPLYLSTKGLTGHTLGAAGGIEAVLTVIGLANGWVPQNAGFEEQDPEIPITPTRELTTFGGDCALSTSLAFGGSNAALVFKKVGATEPRWKAP